MFYIALSVVFKVVLTVVLSVIVVFGAAVLAFNFKKEVKG